LLRVELSLVGFVMTYVFQITGTLTTMTRFVASFEGDVVSLRRVQEYIAMGDEKPEGVSRLAELGSDAATETTPLLATAEDSPNPAPDIDSLAQWPTAGNITFNCFSTRYRPSLPLSLHNITLAIQPGEKVAVVGRTGAGKTSLVLALLGLLRATSGQVTIDDVDLAGLNSVQLRRKLALIPQNPVVFPGTVRENVDPLGIAEDEDILEALERATASAALGRLVRGSGEADQERRLLDAIIQTG
jgi:ATP-binding cassette, subfamily C (CFTR/MRP), member 1